jgi:glycerol-3-phosphate dehydrogenase (NAD(P)+)
MSKVAVIGAGAWGTALAIQTARAGHRVTLVTRNPAAAVAIEASRENHRLPGVPIPSTVEVSCRLPAGSDLLVWAVPTQELRSSLLRIRPSDEAIVVCAKGVEAGSHMLPLEIVEDVSPAHPLAILSGPNFAHELAAGLPAATVVASSDADLRELVRTCLGTNTFRIYGNDDPIGAQLGGAAKNVIAIAAGAVIGAGLGENARAALVTRGLSELCRLGIALGDDRRLSWVCRG